MKNILALLLGVMLAAQPNDPKVAVKAQRTFGFHLLRELAGGKPGENVFISPLSVFLALQMAENGAAGTTREAMRKALALPNASAAELNQSAAALQDILGERASLTIANALWADRHFTLAPDFVKLCQAVFHARAAPLNFADPAAAAEINDWVKTNTNGKIAGIVTPDMVKQAAVILTNAVYFAGKWQHEFPAGETQDGVFHLTGGGTKTVAMMHQARLAGGYRSGPNYEGAMMYYQGSSVFFYALLPQPGKAAKDLPGLLDGASMSAAPAEFDVDLKLPRFGLDFSASLAEPLKKMGMDIAFHYPKADFAPMGSKQFYISDVIHKTRLEVDEKGTVAAAASAVIMRAGAVMAQQRPIKTLVFDRPFAVLIGDSQTGAILFAGVVEEPAALR